MRKLVSYILLWTVLGTSLWAQTPYEKFRSGKNLESESSFLTVYKQKEKLFLEIPDSVMGRRVLVNSIIRSTSNPSVPVGTDISSSRAYKVDRTDSLLLFLDPAAPFSSEESGIARAMSLSRTDAIVYALPIKYRSADSTLFVIEADKFLDPSQKDVASLNGNPYGDYKISTAAFKKELSAIKGISSYPGSVGILRTLTYDIKLGGIFGELVETYKFTGDVETCITLLPESGLKPLKADDRIGTRTVSYPSLDAAAQGYRDLKWASRWNLQEDRRIEVYIDTLLAEPWRNAVSEGLLEWNKAFREAGLGDKIVVCPFPAEDFNACNPLVNTVMLGGGTSVSAHLITDPQTGEILSFGLTVPSDFVSSVRREGMVFMSDVDPRYQSYNVPQDAVAEALKARVMSTFGLCLGLTRNMAGSHAYSPKQLRDPAFTSVRGITASVTDNVLFNLLALPGDKERGVETVVSQLGTYDIYAIRWLYDDTLDRESWLESHYGKPEYLYLPLTAGNPDPRALSGDLGDDPFEFAGTIVKRLKWVASNAAQWISGEEVEQTYQDLFADFVFLGVDRALAPLSSLVGGIIADNRSVPKYSSVPAKTQKEAISLILKTWTDFSWFDSNRELLTIAGANSGTQFMAITSAWQQSRLSRRYDYLAMSSRLVPKAYTLEEALEDIEDILFDRISSGKDLKPGEEILISQYATSLYGRSPILSAQASPGKQQALAVRDVPLVYTQETEAVCYRAFIRLKEALEGIRDRRKGAQAAKIDFILNYMNKALEQ